MSGIRKMIHLMKIILVAIKLTNKSYDQVKKDITLELNMFHIQQTHHGVVQEFKR